MGDRRNALPPRVLNAIDCWSALWGFPDLRASVEITFSARLRSTLARCRAAAGRITLRADLRNNRSGRLEVVLCHELAHVAVHRLHGTGVDRTARSGNASSPWRGEPRVYTRERVRSRRVTPRTVRSAVYEHRCPVCQTMRLARRPVGQWRCAECLDAGLEGRLVVSKRSRAEPREQRRLPLLRPGRESAVLFGRAHCRPVGRVSGERRACSARHA